MVVSITSTTQETKKSETYIKKILTFDDDLCGTFNCVVLKTLSNKTKIRF